MSDTDRVAELANRVLERARQAARSLPTRHADHRPSVVFSGPAPDSRDPSAVSEALQQLVADRGWAADTALGRIWGDWESIVGPTLAAHVEPESFDRNSGRLVLRADSTAWATQVRLLASQLRKRLRDELPGQLLTEVLVLGPDVGPRPRGRLRVKGPGPRDTYG